MTDRPVQRRELELRIAERQAKYLAERASRSAALNDSEAESVETAELHTMEADVAELNVELARLTLEEAKEAATKNSRFQQ